MKIVGKRKRECFRSKRLLAKKVVNNYPIIKRDDIMELILSDTINEDDRVKFSRMYNEIINLETRDLKYITYVAVSNANYAEIYNLIERYMNKK